MWPLQQPGRKGKSQGRPDGLCFALCLIASLPREALLGGKNTRATKKNLGSEDREAAGGLANAIVSATTVSQQPFGFFYHSDFFQRTPVSTRDAEPKKSAAILDMICQNQP
jgi:hypothetical protein